MERNNKYKIATQCFTYNQKAYINDTLVGFTSQQTSFSMVFIVIDDASTDGESLFLSDWAEANLNFEDKENSYKRDMPYGKLIFARHNTNTNAFFAILLLSENHYQSGRNNQKMNYIAEWCSNSDYIAICEGDDFWVSPNKLQKQVDFLDDHPDYSMCFHNAVIIYEDTAKAATIFNNIGENREVKMEELIEKWMNPTASIVYRTTVLPLFIVNKNFISGDWQLTLHCAACGKVWGMKDVMSFYRKTYNGNSIASFYKDRNHEIILQKANILEGLDEYTNGKYHSMLERYMRKYREDAKYALISKNKGAIIAPFLMPLYIIKKCCRKLFH